jgi:hypothetical protein
LIYALYLLFFYIYLFFQNQKKTITNINYLSIQPQNLLQGNVAQQPEGLSAEAMLPPQSHEIDLGSSDVNASDRYVRCPYLSLSLYIYICIYIIRSI